jgi:hypothetical protein
MPRYWEPITLQTLKDKIQLHTQEAGHNYRELTKQIMQDIKVSFDSENYDYGEGEFGPNNMTGYKTLPNGMSYFGCAEGGDWEHSVFYIIYWDGKKLRGYVPTEGNPHNTDTKEAYGNDEEADIKNFKKRYPDVYYDPRDNGMPEENVDWDPNKIKEDIMSRIVLKPSSPSSKPSKTKLVYSPSRYDILKNKVEALKFYGCGDEAFEDFCEICHLCYKMSDDPTKAEILYQWAKEAADYSYEFAKQEEYNYMLEDVNSYGWGN